MYAALAVGAVLLTIVRFAPFAVAGAALGLLFTGIHNAWDSVTYIVTGDHGAKQP